MNTCANTCACLSPFKLNHELSRRTLIPLVPFHVIGQGRRPANAATGSRSIPPRRRKPHRRRLHTARSSYRKRGSAMGNTSQRSPCKISGWPWGTSGWTGTSGARNQGARAKCRHTVAHHMIRERRATRTAAAPGDSIERCGAVRRRRTAEDRRTRRRRRNHIVLGSHAFLWLPPLLHLHAATHTRQRQCHKHK